MVIAGIVLASLACVLMGALSVLLATAVLKPDNRLVSLESKLNTQALEMENVYDQVLRWNKKGGKNSAHAENFPTAESRNEMRRRLSQGARV